MSERRALAYALAAVLLWSTVATGFKLGLAHFEPLGLVLAGSAVSTVVFWVAALGAGEWRLSGRGLAAAAAFGLLNPLAYYAVLFEAYARLPAQLAQPLNYTWALTLALLAWPILGQRPSRRTLTGIAISYVGVVIVVTGGRVDRLPGADPLGIALALGSTVLWAAYWLLATRVRLPPLPLMAWSFTFATPVVALLCALQSSWPTPGPELAVFGAWIGLVEMGVTFLLWQRALRLTANAARTAQLIFVAPFVSLLLIGAVLDERVRASSWLGLTAIVAGLVVTTRGGRGDSGRIQRSAATLDAD